MASHFYCTAMLHGSRIVLRPMTLRERRTFFQWATQSDATEWWYGSRYGDEIPSYEVFKLDWERHYFEDGHPDMGRCYSILVQDRAIGQVNYNPIHQADRSTEMDILIAHDRDKGHGYGSEAIRLLAGYLFEELEVSRIRIEVIAQNPRAIHSYARAGFQVIYTYILNGIEWRVMERLADPIRA